MASAGGLVKHNTVILTADGAFVCDCEDYRASAKTCSHAVASRYTHIFGPPGPYLAAERGPEEHGPKAKGKKQAAPAPKSHLKKGQKSNLPDDREVDNIHDLFLNQLDEDHDWNPFPAPETEAHAEKVIPTGKTGTRGRPGSSKPLQPGRNRPSQSPTKFSAKPGPKGHGYNSLLPALTGKSPTKIHPAMSMETPMDEVKKPYISIPAISHRTREDLEDLDMADITYNRWLDSSYTLRHDEVLAVIDILNSLCLTRKNGILVYGPMYIQDAEILRKTVWTSSDDPPILSDGAPAFAVESSLHKAWHHSQSMNLSHIFIFHHDARCHHWLLFKFGLLDETIECFDPRKKHAPLPDIQDMRLLAQFFSPVRPTQRPPPKRFRKYDWYELDIQHDDASCGFWMISLAFIFICGIELSDPELAGDHIDILESLGIDRVKAYWQAIMISWRVEDDGLGILPVNSFLEPWKITFVDEPGTTCLAPRPSWVSRFDPEVAAQAQADIILTMEQPGAPSAQNSRTTLKTDLPVLGYSGASANLANAAKAFEAFCGVTLETVLSKIKASIRPDTSMSFGKDTISSPDFARFLEGRANDHCINIYVTALNFLGDQVDDFFGYDLHLPRPTPNFHIVSSFFYPKLKEYGDAWDAIDPTRPETTAAVQKLSNLLLRWFKKLDVTKLMRVFIPVHQQDHSHWFLVLIQFEQQRVVFIDSWGPNQTSYTLTEFSALPFHDQVYRNCRLLVSLLLKGRDIANPLVDADQWRHSLAGFSPQQNSHDCGFYLLISLIQLLHFDALNPAKCHPALLIHGTTMQYTRVLLAIALVPWCEGHKASQTSKTIQQTSTLALIKAVGPKLESGNNSKTPNVLPLAPAKTETDSVEPDSESSKNLKTPNVLPLAPAFELQARQSRSCSPIPSSVDGEDFLAPNKPLPFEIPSPLAHFSPLNPLQIEMSRLLKDTSPISSHSEDGIPDALIKKKDFPFSCRCGAHGDGNLLAGGLPVVQCDLCNAWSHISCARFGRAADLRKNTVFFCDICIRETPPVPSPPKSKARKPRPSFKPGMGALAKHGKYYYPVRLLHRNATKKSWRVSFWRGCEFPAEDPGPDSNKLVLESDMVDSLYGNQAGRRGIRLGKFKHAHEISVEEDILDDFRNHTFSPELDNILQPHREILLSIFSKPWKDNKAIPAVEYILNSVKGKTIPYAGDLSLLEQAQIMNWFYNKIPLARGHLTEWVGLPPHAHAITIVIASRNERELRDNPNFPTDAPEAKQLQTLWDWAWCLQRTQCRVPVADVDRECLGLLEQWMFESSDAAGLAGDEQWGLDAGHHQDRWQPYIGLPAEWSSYRSGKEDDEKYRRGLNFSVDGLSGDEASAHKPLRSAHIQPKPRKRTVLVAVKA